MESRTQLKTVKITSNIFAVCCRLIAGIGKKEKTKEEEEQIKKAPFYGITVHNLQKSTDGPYVFVLFCIFCRKLFFVELLGAHFLH